MNYIRAIVIKLTGLGTRNKFGSVEGTPKSTEQHAQSYRSFR